MRSNFRVGEWMWRFLALTMLVMLGWMMWVMYQLSPPELVLNAAFEAAAKSSAKGSLPPNPGAQGVIKPAVVEQSPTPVATAATVVGEAGKPMPEKPAPAAAPAPPAVAKPDPAQVIGAVETWARAWSAKDVAGYLAAYAPSFKTPSGEPREEWAALRKQRVSAPKSITIGIDSPEVKVEADDKVSVNFKQTYRSDIVTSSVSSKTLEMVRVGGRWLIQREFEDN